MRVVKIGDSTLYLGDCIATMRTMADNSVDSIVTDPPYELGFMGKAWDNTGIANSIEMWAEALRVLKPGGHLLAFSGSRTYHRMTCAIEDAGFDIRDQIMWVYGSGFPKSLDVSKAIDGHLAGGKIDSRAMRQVNETRPGEATTRPSSQNGHAGIVGSGDVGPSVKRATPATDAARQWDGWGTALKPAHEPICVARKPLIGTVAANVLAHGTGALNIDGCRVAGDLPTPFGNPTRAEGWRLNQRETDWQPNPTGRWPANLIHDGSDEVLALFPGQAGAAAPVKGTEASAASTGNVTGERARVAGAFHGDTGSAARFFYCAKTSKADRGANIHPTVKPTDLMAYLVRLVTPPGGLVLDPFMGSGSTGKACMREGFRFVGCELSAEYIDIASARITAELAKPVQKEMFA